MADLFHKPDALETIPLRDGALDYIASLDLGQPPERIMENLIADTPWRAEDIVIWGKILPQPRLIAWYGDPTREYGYSGLKLAPYPWTDLLLDLKRRVEAKAETEFNSVLLNYYRNQNDSISPHSDDEPELGKNPVIASLSFGCERTFILKHKTERALKPVRLKLASGSLLVMKGATQHHWKHYINKETQNCGPRVNLTFRTIF